MDLGEPKQSYSATSGLELEILFRAMIRGGVRDQKRAKGRRKWKGRMKKRQEVVAS